ncbi:MAG: DUF563 domain-containing protein, partial [Methylobacteriaceae bacterium]|nr:DUF563 domain-containing protein [Methylobacteriaceae bacterium]
MKLFREILVMPSQGLANGVAATPGRKLRLGLFRGGPVWPFFYLQVLARHCRGPVPVPFDRKPHRASAPATGRIAEAVWCGPISPHYGHMVADFAMRVAASADGRPDLPLLFSFWPEPGEEPPEFFWEIVDHLGVARERVRLVREPTRVGRLWVAPQAERLGGKGPSPRHLDLMDRIVARHGTPQQDIDVLFVSRALLGDGRLAGEAYLDA